MENIPCDPDIKKWVSCSFEQLFSSLKTNSTGLSTTDADERLRQYGENILPERKKHRLYKKLIIQFKNLFNILLLIAALLSFITGWSANDAGSVQMGLAILGVVIISVLFNLFQEHRAERAVEAIRGLVPQNARVIRDGQTKEIPIKNIVPGDIISLEEGDKVPADARILNSYEFSVDNSTLTGESEPQPRSSDISTGSSKNQIIECLNMVFAGTTVASGTATAVVLATASNTQFGKIVTIAQTIEEPPSPLQREIDYTAKLNFGAAIGVGVLFLTIALFFLHLQLSESILFMIGVMISLVPEGLQITITLSLALSSLAMAKRNVIVKRLSSVETLGSATVICSDKTGTITTGQMTVRKIWIGGHTFDVTGEGYEPEGSIFSEGNNVNFSNREDLYKLCQVAALDNKATLVPPLDRKKSRWTAFGDSTDAALLVLAAKAGIQYKQELIQNPRVGLIPFESTRKMMTSIHKGTDGKLTAYVKGAGNEILSKCTSVYWNKQIIPLTEELTKQIRTEIDTLARQAYRVLALAVRDLPNDSQKFDAPSVENTLAFIGLVAIYDPPRRDVPNAVQKAQNAGVRIIMMTGDHELTAEAIARKVGIITSKSYVVTTGYKLTDMSDDELNKLLDVPDVVFARITPEQKLRIVRVLKSKGETVAVTGDGANDAPALLEADIGIAMGITGTDVARESADMILMDDNFASIVSGMEEGRSVFDNLQKFNVYVFTHNWAELATFIAFVLLQTPLPLAIVGILLIDLVLDIPPSLALTLEPPEPGIMERPPRKKENRLFNIKSLARSGYIGLFIGTFALVWCFYTWSQTGWSIGQPSMTDHTAYLKGTTMVIVGIMAGQLGMLIATRTNIKSTFSVSLRHNKWLLIAILIELLILFSVVYIPFFSPVFNTISLQPLDWIFLYSIVPLVILFEEVRKLLLRKYFLPTTVVPVHRIIPSISGEFEIPVEKKVPLLPQFIECNNPIILSLTSQTGEENTAVISMNLARNTGSRLFVLRILNEQLKTSLDYNIERILRDTAEESGVPCQYIDVRAPQTIESSVNETAEKTQAETIIISVPRDVFYGGHHTAQFIKWIEKIPNKKIILISNPTKLIEPRHPPFRVLIPVLHEFHEEPFNLTKVLTAHAPIPDVDIIAAKVIEFPSSVQLYSRFYPESMVVKSGEFSILRRSSVKALRRHITPLTLYFQDISRGIAHFVEERKIDMIIMEGDWSEKKNGFLKKAERKIVKKAQCSIIVTLTHRTM
jgi:magnesium-transporting ATPase (P-type)